MQALLCEDERPFPTLHDQISCLMYTVCSMCCVSHVQSVHCISYFMYKFTLCCVFLVHSVYFLCTQCTVCHMYTVVYYDPRFTKR